MIDAQQYGGGGYLYTMPMGENGYHVRAAILLTNNGDVPIRISREDVAADLSFGQKSLSAGSLQGAPKIFKLGPHESQALVAKWELEQLSDEEKYALGHGGAVVEFYAALKYGLDGDTSMPFSEMKKFKLIFNEGSIDDQN